MAAEFRRIVTASIAGDRNIHSQRSENLCKVICFEACGIISGTLGKKVRRGTTWKFYKVMAVPVLLHGSERSDETCEIYERLQ
jgi:hypothetical protein